MNMIKDVKNKSAIRRECFFVFAYISALFFIKLKVPFTNSGEITFYFVEIMGLIVGLYLIIYIAKSYKNMSKNQKILLWSVVISQVVFLMIYIYRIVFDTFEMKSILIIESNLFVIGFYLLIVFGIVPAKKILDSLSTFLSVLGFLSIISIFVLPDSYTDYVVFYSDQFYILTFGNAIRSYILLITLPLSALHYYINSSKKATRCFYVHLVSLVACGMISGARVNYLCIPLLIFLLGAIACLNKKYSFARNICLFSVFTVIGVFLMSPFSMCVYSQMMRLDVTKQVMQTFDVKFIGIEKETVFLQENANDSVKSEENDSVAKNNENEELQEYLNSAGESAEESSNTRWHMWELAINDIKEAPLIGKGLRQYQFTYDNGVTLSMQVHNFILEYLLAFGLVGFFFWAIMIIIPEWLVLIKIKFRIWKSTSLLLTFCSIAMACAGALFQPYFLYPCVMFFVFVMMGCYYSISNEIEIK